MPPIFTPGAYFNATPIHLTSFNGNIWAGKKFVAHALKSDHVGLRQEISSQNGRPPPADAAKVYAVSDCHFDYEENLQWAKNVHKDRARYKNDILILAGDACDSLSRLQETLSLLRDSFSRVFYTPGNHELWVKSIDIELGISDSIVKLERIITLCKSLDVAICPERVGNTWLVPLYSWHHSSFDAEPDIPGVPAASAMTLADYSACQWPEQMPGFEKGGGAVEVARWFDGLNDGEVWEEIQRTREECDIISFSHFLPLQALMPEKRYLFYPNLMKASGSTLLEQRLADLKPNIHVFGHTHFSWDATIQGVRYIQAPLCSPSERRRRLRTVCFDAAMNAAQKDPIAAAWLPLRIYDFNSTGISLTSSSRGEKERDGKLDQQCSIETKIAQLLYGSDSTNSTSSSCTSTTNDMLTRSIKKVGLDDAVVVELGESCHLPKELERKNILPLETVLINNKEDSSSSSSSDSSDDSSPEELEDDIKLLDLTINPPINCLDATASDSDTKAALATQASARMGHLKRCGQSLQHGVACKELGAHWSDHYRQFDRTPDVTELAPWVASFYSKRRARIKAKDAT